MKMSERCLSTALVESLTVVYRKKSSLCFDFVFAEIKKSFCSCWYSLKLVFLFPLTRANKCKCRNKATTDVYCGEFVIQGY